MSTTCIIRCSGDSPQAKLTKYTMGLPVLPEKVIAERLGAGITEAKHAIAAAPGTYGRIWLGQSLAFDEAYQILHESMPISDACMHSIVCCAQSPSVLHVRSPLL